MPITSFVEIHFASETLATATERLSAILADTRAFDGCLRIDVLVDPEDECHFLLDEQWETMEHDLAYRAWRQGEGATDLRTFQDRPTVITYWSPSPL